MTLLFCGHDLLESSRKRERGVVGAGVGTKLDDPRERWEGSLLPSDPCSHSSTLSSFSTLALVMVMLGLLSWPGDAPGVRLMHMVGSESDLPDTRDVKFGLALSHV